MDIDHPENAEFRAFLFEVRAGELHAIETMAARAKDQGREDLLPMLRMGWRTVRDSNEPDHMMECVTELRKWIAAKIAREDNVARTNREDEARAKFYANR